MFRIHSLPPLHIYKMFAIGMGAKKKISHLNCPQKFKLLREKD